MKVNNFGSKYISVQTKNNNLSESSSRGFLVEEQTLHMRDSLMCLAGTRRLNTFQKAELESR
jgi:hypothetical protein